MNRFSRIFVLGAVAALLVSGLAFAAKPIPATPAGLAWAATSTGNTLAGANGSGVLIPTTVATLTLPVDGRYVVHATVTVGNPGSVEAQTVCELQVAAPGTTAVGFFDLAYVKMAAANAAGADETRIALTGVYDRVGATSLTISLVCASNQPGYTGMARLNATSVSAVTNQ